MPAGFASAVFQHSSIIFIYGGIIGTVLGVKANKVAPSGMSKGGLVLSIIGIVLSVILWIVLAVCAIALVGTAASLAGMM